MVVTNGLAVTTAPVVALRPVPGIQLYVVAPPTVNTTLPPGQKLAVMGVKVNEGGTVIVPKLVVAVTTHPLLSVTDTE